MFDRWGGSWGTAWGASWGVAEEEQQSSGGGGVINARQRQRATGPFAFSGVPVRAPTARDLERQAEFEAFLTSLRAPTRRRLESVPVRQIDLEELAQAIRQAEEVKTARQRKVDLTADQIERVILPEPVSTVSDDFALQWRLRLLMLSV